MDQNGTEFLGLDLTLDDPSFFLVNHHLTTKKCCEKPYQVPKYREPQEALQHSFFARPPWLGPSPFCLRPFASPEIASTSEGGEFRLTNTLEGSRNL